MALTSDGLIDVGMGPGITANFHIQYESALSDKLARSQSLVVRGKLIANANALLAVVENEFDVTTRWFNTPAGKFGADHRQIVNLNLTGGGNNAGYGTAINMDAQVGSLSSSNAAAICSMIFINEWVEILMSLSDGRWNAADSMGEALSQLCGIERFPAGHYAYYGSWVNTWLALQPRPDWVTATEATDNNPVSFGCGLAYLYFLKAQLGFDIERIIAAGAPDFRAVYANLTGSPEGAFERFLELIEFAFPGTKTITGAVGPSLDNPFPLYPPVLLQGVPAALADPSGYAFVNEATGITEQHTLFRSADGHIHAIWFNFNTGWHREDRTALVPAVPEAVGDPFGYAFVNAVTGITEQHTLFRSADGHIHALWFNFETGWHHEDRSALFPDAPLAVGDPFGYAFVNEATGLMEQHNLFRSADGHVHALWFNFDTGWHHEDRSALLAGVPAAASDPVGYAFISKPTGLVEQHNLFRSADGHVHALWFNFDSGWHHEDRSAPFPEAPAARGDPMGYAFVNESTGITEQHNLFLGGDGHIHALWFNFDAGWHHEDRSALLPNVPLAVSNPFGYAFVNEAAGITEQHNLFRSADGHIHALWFSFESGWHHEDRSAMLGGGFRAVGDPFGYTLINKKTGLSEQHNLMRSAGTHIHSLWFDFRTGWHHEFRA